MMDELEVLKERIDRIENLEIETMKSDIQDLKLESNTNNIYTRQLSDSYKTLNDTMESVKDAMYNISNMAKDTNKQVGNLAEKIVKIEGRVAEVDSKGKFDFVKFVKDNFVGIVCAIGALSYFLSQLM